MSSDNNSNDIDMMNDANGGQHGHHHDLHAHFKEEDDVLDAHDSIVLVEQCGENCLNVRLGFLQVRHVYEIMFTVEDQLGEATFDPLENLNVKIESTNLSASGQGHDIVLVFNAVKEKLMTETVTLRSCQDDSKMLKLVLCARVLGKGKGTPAIKKGIRLLRIEGDEESEASDWQGF